MKIRCSKLHINFQHDFWKGKIQETPDRLFKCLNPEDPKRVSPEDSQAGIGFTVLSKLKRTGADAPKFLGREALEEQRAQGLQRKLVCCWPACLFVFIWQSTWLQT